MPPHRPIAHLVEVKPSRACPLSLAARRPRTRSRGRASPPCSSPATGGMRTQATMSPGSSGWRTAQTSRCAATSRLPCSWSGASGRSTTSSVAPTGRAAKPERAKCSRSSPRSSEFPIWIVTGRSSHVASAALPVFASPVWGFSSWQHLAEVVPATSALEQPQDQQDDSRPEQHADEGRDRDGPEEPRERGRVVPPALGLRLPVDVLARPRVVLGAVRRLPCRRMVREEPARTGEFALHACSAAAERRSSRGQGVPRGPTVGLYIRAQGAAPFRRPSRGESRPHGSSPLPHPLLARAAGVVDLAAASPKPILPVRHLRRPARELVL